MIYNSLLTASREESETLVMHKKDHRTKISENIVSFDVTTSRGTASIAFRLCMCSYSVNDVLGVLVGNNVQVLLTK